MKLARIALAAALLSGGVALYAKPAAPRAITPSPAELVQARQAGMDMSAATLNLLKGASANGVSLKSLAFPAGALAKWAGSMPGLFADSTRSLPSRAQPLIWTQRADFEAKARTMAAAAKALTAAATAENKPAFDAALASTAASCKGCHEIYQTPPPAAKAG